MKLTKAFFVLPLMLAAGPELGKMVELNNQLISVYLSRSTLYNILLYISLSLKVINIIKSRKFPRDLCKPQALEKDLIIG
jgi:hypothetical protein